MGEALKKLGEALPLAATLTDLYTVPGATQATASTLLVCNQNTTGNIRFRVSVAVGGAVNAPGQYLYWDVQLSNRDTFAATLGITLGAGDVVRVRTDTANVSFNLFGVEVT